ncbi:CsbD family protein [Promicromonospora sp. MEB111]|uniref:CsbD family protein n=1 Tax=Promicromonospora sp. MEB111 TaxID=3040301 RepID=UPI00254B9543|nr:CsbD family protein [Promicromonospora sp. MEB111]
MGAEDKAKIAAEKVAGKAKEGAGKVTGDDDLVAEGKAEQAKAELKDAAEHAKDAFKK